MTLNPELLRHRAAEIRQNLALLRPLAGLSGAQLDSEPERRDAALFRLLVAIEAAQAICTHLAARIPTRAPDSMPDCFQAVVEAGVIDGALGDRLARMSRFRNLLVHRYWELDMNVVAQILEEPLDDLEAWLEAVERYARLDS